MGSCGFEHVFMNEIKNNEISGLHNWIYFSDQENDNRQSIDYRGYMKSLYLGNVSKTKKKTIFQSIITIESPLQFLKIIEIFFRKHKS